MAKKKEQRWSKGGYRVIPRHYHVSFAWHGKKYRIYCSSENLKVRGLIINSQSALNCWERKHGFCQIFDMDGYDPEKTCYACVTETRFPSCFRARTLMQEVWEEVPSHVISDAYLHILTRGNRFEHFISPLNYWKIRFNEAGGTWSQELLEKFEYCAKTFYNFGRTRAIRALSQLFTSNPNLDISPLKHLVVKKSGKTGPCYHGRAVIFTDERDIPDNYVKCWEDCRICSHCHVKGRNIALIVHSGMIEIEKLRQIGAIGKKKRRAA